MTLRPLCAVLLTLCLAGALNAQDAAPTPAVFDYFAELAARQSAALPPIADSLEAWQQQRTVLVERLDGVLGLPQREPMRAAVIASRADGDLIVEQVAFLWAEGTYASGTLVRSGSAEGRRGAVVMPSGYLGHYTFSPYRGFVDRLARDGLMVLFVDDPRTGRRHAPHAGLYATAAAAGTPMAGVQVFDALRGLDYLLTRADVDPGKIGIAGLGAGAMQATLAAAVEPRVQFVVAVGPTTCQAMVQAAAEGRDAEDPSMFVAGLIGVGGMDRVAACLAPRSALLAGCSADNSGCAQVVGAMQAVYQLHDAADRLRVAADGPADAMTPHAATAAEWLGKVLPSLPASDVQPAPCGEPESPDFSMLRYFQRCIANKNLDRPFAPGTWREQLDETRSWLRDACDLQDLQPGDDELIESAEADGLITERLSLGVDAGWQCPAVLVRPSESTAAKAAGVVFSHDDRQCAASAKVAEAARRLAAAGYWVIVPDHASADPQSGQTLANAEAPRFYGDAAARLYGPADAVNRPPLAMRVAENLAALRYLTARNEVDAARVVIGGMGVGSIDAAMAALLAPDVAGVVAIDVTTVGDWAANAVPEEMQFCRIMPYLPGINTATDLECVFAALAPRPLVTARLRGGWPRTGFDHVMFVAKNTYEQEQAAGALLAFGGRPAGPGAPSAELLAQLNAVAEGFVPAPPTPGRIGSAEALRSRQTVDSAAGLVWVVAEMGQFEQAFVDGGYRVTSWSLFNDNGAAQQGRQVTPLIFRQQGDTYELIGIGTTRTNAGTGLQTFPFEVVEGADAVAADCVFGWHTGAPSGQPNAGAIEFNDDREALMKILTITGALDNQAVSLGAKYNVQSQFRRQYSVSAVSEKAE